MAQLLVFLLLEYRVCLFELLFRSTHYLPCPFLGYPENLATFGEGMGFVPFQPVPDFNSTTKTNVEQFQGFIDDFVFCHDFIRRCL